MKIRYRALAYLTSELALKTVFIYSSFPTGPLCHCEEGGGHYLRVRFFEVSDVILKKNFLIPSRLENCLRSALSYSTALLSLSTFYFWLH